MKLKVYRKAQKNRKKLKIKSHFLNELSYLQMK